MDAIIFIVYIIAGYWALNKVWYSRRVYLVSDSGQFYMRKVIYAFLLGWALIPIAVVMLILKK